MGAGSTPAATPAALEAVTSLLVAGVGVQDPSDYAALVLRRARVLLDAEATALVVLDGDHASLLGAEPAVPPGAVLEAPAVTLARAGVEPGLVEDPALLALAGRAAGDGHALVAGTPVAPRASPVLLVAVREAPFGEDDLAAARTLAAATAAGLSHMGAARHQADRAAEQAALRRAAERLNAHLDVTDAVGAICREARAILGADYAGVYRRDGDELVLEADEGFDQPLVGLRFPLGRGMAGKVAATGEALYHDDYMAMADPGPKSIFSGIRTCYGAPLRWDGEVHGALSVGFYRTVPGGREDLPLLEAFAELASAAYKNAEVATALAVAARTDGLTGCLNHGAFVEEVAREVARASRSGRPPALLMVDLDRFKAVNDDHGHRTGDDLLRAAGDALRAVTREEDLVGRLGGDEFAVLLVDADAGAAEDTARRLLDELAAARRRLGVTGTAGTAGLAVWSPGMGGEALLDAADRALLEAKRSGRRGGVARAPEAPAPPARSSPRVRAVHAVPADRAARRMRSLALTNRLAVRIAGLTDVREIAAMVVEELHRTFDFHLSAVLRITPDRRVEDVAVRGSDFEALVLDGWSQPVDQGIIGRCLQTRAPVRVDDVLEEPGYVVTAYTGLVRAECCVPIEVGGELWGALNVEDVVPGAFDEDDVRVLQTIASITGAALRAAVLYESLDGAYLETVQALATALELKDGYTAHHADAVGERAEAVGRALGLEGDGLRDLRLGAALHDIGKLAVPEAILNKPGRLTDEERLVVERHTIAGDQILAGIERLGGARRVVRHSHERFDGGGYPDGLAGADIPLGARIVFVCDAYDAMTTDRPYRAAMDPAAAREELRRGAGTQFDPAVVEAFLALAA